MNKQKILIKHQFFNEGKPVKQWRVRKGLTGFLSSIFWNRFLPLNLNTLYDVRRRLKRTKQLLSNFQLWKIQDSSRAYPGVKMII